MTLVSGNISHL